MKRTSLSLVSSILVAAPASAQDCNGNNVPDATDIALGTSLDCNTNGIPDECDVGDLVLYLDFDGSQLPNGVTYSTTNLWHVTNACQPGGTCGQDNFMYFGVDSQCDHEIGDTLLGSFTLHGVPVPELPVFAKLTYCEVFESECCDWGTVSVNNVEVVYKNCSNPIVWVEEEVDLAPWAGQTVDIRWTFQTCDAMFNFYYGWAIDNVRVGVEGSHPDCDENGVPDECDLDYDNNGTPDACDPPLGDNYCVATANSTGQPASLYALGSPLIADDDVTLVTVDAPPNTVGYYLMSEAQGFIPGFGGGQGNLCLGPPIYRFSHQPGGVLQSGDAGIMGYELDLGYLPQSVVFLPFDTWNFQLWYRDNNPGSTSNTSDGVAITFF